MDLDKQWRCQNGARCYVRCEGCPGPVEEQPSVSAEHQNALAKVYSDLATRQEPLGAEFEKVWSENLENLYEN